MNTQNHKPATTADILPPTPPSTLDTQPSRNPFSAAARARCGKVARLPKEIRDQLNEMLLDNVPHPQIIQKLRQNFGPRPNPDSNVVPLAPTADSPTTPTDPPTPDSTHHETRNTQHDSSTPAENQSPVTNHQSLLATLTPHHITTWKKFGGYRDWLKDQQRLEECKLRHELTLDLARSAEGLASYQAAPKVAVAQICQTIIDLGPEGLKEAMKDSPLNCFRLLNALARLINSGLKCENQIQKAAIEANQQNVKPIDRERLHQIEADLNLL